MKKTLLVLIIVFCWLVVPAQGAKLEYDLGINHGDISFSRALDNMVIGQPLRIYAKVNNLGQEDVIAHVIFYDGDTFIGQSQPVSVRADGLADEVYVDWTVPDHEFNILAKIAAFDPQDDNSANNQALSVMFTPLKDFDHDGIADDQDADDDNDGVNDELDDDPFDSSIGQLAVEQDLSDVAVPEPVTEQSIVENNEPVQEQPKIEQNDNSQDEVKNEDKEAEIEELLTEEDTDEIVEKINQKEYKFDEIFAGYLESGNIKYKKIAWNKYVFEAKTNDPNEDVSFQWDFGDNTISSQQAIAHKFDQGNYQVKLTVQDVFGNKLEDQVDIKVNFWELSNRFLWMYGLLMLILIALVAVIVWYKSKSNDQKEVKELVDEKEINN